MIKLVEGAERQKTPNEIALDILLAGLTIVFLFATVTLRPFALYSGSEVSPTVLVALLVCLIPTTIGGLLSAIGIAGMDRVLRHNVLAMSGRAVEASGDVNVLLLDKTGTITLGNRQAAELLPAPGVDARELAELAQLASLADETPEGRSIVVLAKEKYGMRGRELRDLHAHFVPFTARTRMSGLDFEGGRKVRKGAADTVDAFVRAAGGQLPRGGPARRRPDRRRGRDAARRHRRREGRRDDLPQGRRQGRDEGAVRPPPGDGNPDRDDHRRQPSHRREHRARGGRRRLPRRGHARGQARPHPEGAGGREPRRDDGRRDERRARRSRRPTSGWR